MVDATNSIIIGTGFHEFRWPRPVRPGDELHIETEILEVRPSKSRPDQGLIKLRTTTFNQNNEPVHIQVGAFLLHGGPSSESTSFSDLSSR